jgi:predicted aldo/keto reductase-like oxidoreductase
MLSFHSIHFGSDLLIAGGWRWRLSPEDLKACTLCGTCEDQCTQHLPIRDRLQEIAAPSSPKT